MYVCVSVPQDRPSLTAPKPMHCSPTPLPTPVGQGQHHKGKESCEVANGPSHLKGMTSLDSIQQIIKLHECAALVHCTATPNHKGEHPIAQTCASAPKPPLPQTWRAKGADGIPEGPKGMGWPEVRREGVAPPLQRPYAVVKMTELNENDSQHICVWY